MEPTTTAERSGHVATQLVGAFFFAAASVLMFAMTPPPAAFASAPYDSVCKLIASNSVPAGVPFLRRSDWEGPQVPNTQGGVLTYTGQSGLHREAHYTIKFPTETCEWTDTSFDVIAWRLDRTSLPPVVVPKTPPPPPVSTKNILTITNGLEYYALVFCVAAIFISAALWAAGSKGKNPGQELTGKRGIIVSLTAALFIGAVPAIMSYVDTQAQSADTKAGIGVMTVTDSSNAGATTATGTSGSSSGSSSSNSDCTLAQVNASSCP